MASGASCSPTPATKSLAAPLAPRPWPDRTKVSNRTKPSATPAAKGGINQFCCATDPNRPCHPTKSGGKIQRQGARAPLTPAWPDPTYPKTSEGSKFAGVFCEAATTDATVDNLAGLPGPGAIILPAAQTLTASQ